jgi:hypothetical protein
MITIFGDFCHFPAIFANFRRFLPIFGDFCQFSAKKLAFISKTNVMIKFLEIVTVVWAKNANIFAEFFGENILKIMTSVLGLRYLLPFGENLFLV